MRHATKLTLVSVQLHRLDKDDHGVQVRQGKLDAARQQQQLAVVCAAGIRSAQAAVRLSRVFKFPGVVNVAGGMNEWTQKGFPVDR